MRVFLASGATVGLIAGLFLTGPAHADVVDIQNRASLRIDGPGAGAQFGWDIDSAGDFDGDGYDDMVAGTLAVPNTGAAHIVFGGPALTSGTLGTSRTIRITGSAPNAQLGVAVAGVGDINKDGLDDVLVGENMTDTAYLVLGTRSPTDIDLTKPAAGWVKFTGSYHSDTGASVAGPGDVNHDGYRDLLIGAAGTGGTRGAAYVVFGRSVPTDVNLTTLTPSQGAAFVGEATGDFLGGAVGGIGDVNSDHIPDIGIGAPWAPNGSQTGRAYVLYGKSGLAGVDLASLPANEGFRIEGTTQSFTGSAIDGFGDLDKDGYDDFAVGSPGYEPLGDYVTVLLGRTTSGTVDLGDIGDRGFRVNGTDRSNGVGQAIAGVGDFDLDGYPDAVVGTPLISPTQDLVALLHGGTALTGGSLASWPSGFSATAGAQFGMGVAGVGDLNGDGGVDIAIGAPAAKVNGTSSGSVYVIYGKAPVVPPDEPVPGPPLTPVAATLKVVARPARKPVHRTGTTVLVRDVTVGAGQTARIVVKAPKRVRVVKTATTVKVRARHAPKRKVVVRITASGAGFTPVTWSRSWRVR